MSIGGITYWNGAGNRLPITLGDGTFLVCNSSYRDLYDSIAYPGAGESQIFGIDYAFGPGPMFEYSLRQGVGITYPSGTFTILAQNGTNVTLNWNNYVGSNALSGAQLKYVHQGWAMKLSGVTSGGLGGGAFGGGLQPN
jgi:hypothetical protein